MLSINMEDVIGVLQTCKPYLIAFGVVLVLAIIAIIAASKLPKATRSLARGESVIAWPLASLPI